jgi:hypothetical protein
MMNDPGPGSPERATRSEQLAQGAMNHTPCRLGLCGDFDGEDYGRSLYVQVVRAELARRLPAACVRVFSPLGAAHATRSDRGERTESLGAWTPARVADLADELDFMLVCGVYSPGESGIGPGPEMRWHVTSEDDSAALRASGVDEPIDVAPHPAILLSRLFPAPVLEKRLEYLRLMGWYPNAQATALVVQGASAAAPMAADLFASVRPLLDDHPEMRVVLAELSERDGDTAFADAFAHAAGEAAVVVHRLPRSASHEDVAAALSAAGGFAGTSQAGCLTALAYGTPWVTLAVGGPSPAGRLVVRQAGELGDAIASAVKAAPDDGIRRRIESDVDAWLDGIATAAGDAARSRHPHGPPDPTRRALEAELAGLRRAHRVRIERANLERVLLADHAARADAEIAVLRRELAALRPRAEQDAAARAAAEAECAALRSTRTFRWTASARGLYRKLGGGSGP